MYFVISTHTLTWSVTTYTVTFCPKFKISTHTLTWSVTFLPAATSRLYEYFNSHAHVERDPYTLAPENDTSNFNSHAHVERDKAYA